jgi:hypothetical protein
MNNVRFVFDSIDMPIFGWNTGTKPSPSIATMFVEHVSGYTKFILKGNLESGVRFVAASGRITFDDTSQKEIHYLFGKSYHYEGISDFKPEESKLRPGESKIKVEDITPIESKSFWDSTAKPILVTLGAVAVIALFFIIRG